MQNELAVGCSPKWRWVDNYAVQYIPTFARRGLEVIHAVFDAKLKSHPCGRLIIDRDLGARISYRIICMGPISLVYYLLLVSRRDASYTKRLSRLDLSSTWCMLYIDIMR